MQAGLLAAAKQIGGGGSTIQPIDTDLAQDGPTQYTDCRMKTPGDSTQVATRRQRRIRNGKYVFCFLLFFSPIFLFEVLYVRRTSPSIIEYQNVEKELSSQTEDAKVLILGNSIPRRWHPWLSSNENPHLSAEKNDGILNLALGGAPPDDWAFLLEKSLRVTPHLKRVFAVGKIGRAHV